VQFLKNEREILQPLDAGRARFLGALFAAGRRGPKYLTLEVDGAAATLGESRDRITRALTWLEENGAITQKPAGLRHGFRRCPDAAQHDAATVAARLADLFAQREARDSQRLGQILDFARETGCITRRLLAYFGETLEEGACGHCHYCKSGEPATAVKLPATPARPFKEEDLEAIRELIFAEHAPLRSARQVTRFLCGLTSPATSRGKLTKQPLFGRYASTPFREVLAQVERAMED
jgi:ATP-dependent DNA helicase RecQ